MTEFDRPTADQRTDRPVYKEITLLMKYKYKVKYVIFVLDGGQTSSTDGQGQ